MSKLFRKVYELFCSMINSQFLTNDPPQTMRKTVKRKGAIKSLCEEVIEDARKADNAGKLQVKKNGVVRDENGYRVEAFAFYLCRFIVEGILYIAMVVDMLYEEVHLLLIRSDGTKPESMNSQFPDIGTKEDWSVLQKCAKRFSPESASHRYKVDMQTSLRTAAKSVAEKYLEQSGTFRRQDMEVLQGMSAAKIHLLTLCSIATLFSRIPDDLKPRLIHEVVVQDSDDLEEVRRVLRAWNIPADVDAAGLEVPSVAMKGVTALNDWRKGPDFSYMTYEEPDPVKYLFEDMAQAHALKGEEFSARFPHLPVLVGSQIWSNRNCVEIDMRGVRFTDEELLVGRKYNATLLKYHLQIMTEFAKAWKQSLAAQDAAIKPYPRLWYETYHCAAGMVLFPAGYELLDYLALMREADASRLRLRTSRETRHAAAIEKLETATPETAPWLCPSKPVFKDEALALLEGEFDAFLHRLQEGPVLAFTEDSLVRCTGLERCEVDFISKLKAKHLLSSKTHPVSFRKDEQHRFICVKAKAVTVTAADG